MPAGHGTAVGCRCLHDLCRPQGLGLDPAPPRPQRGGLAQYNPGIRTVLARLADSATTDFEIIEYATQQAFASVAHATEANTIAFDRAAWQRLSVGLQRAVLRQAVLQLKGQITNLKFSAIEEARDVLTSDATTGEIALLADVRIFIAARSFAIRLLVKS